MDCSENQKIEIKQELKNLLDYLFEYDNYNFISLVSVLFGGKKVSRLCLSEEFIERLIPLISEYKICYSFIPRAKTNDAFYFEKKNATNKYRLSQEDIEALKVRNHYLYLSYDETSMNALKDAEIAGEFKKAGYFFGYPSCCINNYCSKKSVSDVSLANRALKNSSLRNNFSFINNVCRQGKTIILHFPCSLDCKDSIKIGKTFFKIICAIDKNYARKYEDELTKAVFISKDFLINFQEKIPEFKKEIVNFTKKGVDAKKVMLIEENKIQVDNRLYKGNLIYFE